MPAMTMSFDVDPALLVGVEPGMAVRFHLERGEATLRVVDLKVRGRARDANAPGRLDRLPKESEPAPIFQLVDQTGRARSLAEWRGFAVLLDFGFTRCVDVCPIQTAGRVSLLNQLPAAVAERTRLVTISVDPVHDTPRRLAEYANHKGADLVRWSFLTGEPAAVQEVLDAYRVGAVRRADGTLDHLVVAFLIDPDGRIAKIYLGLDHRATELAADLGAVLARCPLPDGGGPATEAARGSGVPVCAQ